MDVAVAMKNPKKVHHKKVAAQKRQDLRDAMAIDGSRGRQQPLSQEAISKKRRTKELMRLLDEGRDKDGYVAFITEDLGLLEGSPDHLAFLDLWKKRHGY